MPGNASGQGGAIGNGRQRARCISEESDRWLPAMPTLDSNKFKGRLEEITGFETYVESLISWVGLVSDSFANEISFSVRAAAEIRQEDLTAQQVSRGLRLLNILKSSFQPIPKAAT